ncbi:DNA pilot protein [Blackfly microvirus SF02]|uniref:DNA pilot protein n=1 Tax=Blackfly microvirus SF02 TaxID=2576452 RepID=A0A4P8PK54_9VIRU|nr:DNA pilot protein [Blackfly microvirus SF02]
MEFGDPLVGAGVGFLGGIVNNLFAGARQEDSQNFNMLQNMMQNNVNAQQAGIQRDWTSDQAAQARDFTANQSQTQRDWTQQMSSTAYQRTMADMSAAGLNPILAYRQGATSSGSGAAGSASAPSGAAAASVSPAHANPAQVFDILGPALNSAMSVQRLENETKLADSEVRLKDQQARTDSVRAGTLASEAGHHTQATRESQEQTLARKAREDDAAIQSKFSQSRIGEILRLAGLGGQSVADVTRAIPSFNFGKSGGTSNSTWANGAGGSDSASFSSRFGFGH